MDSYKTLTSICQGTLLILKLVLPPTHDANISITNAGNAVQHLSCPWQHQGQKSWPWQGQPYFTHPYISAGLHHPLIVNFTHLRIQIYDNNFLILYLSMPWAGRHMAQCLYKYYIMQTTLIRKIIIWFYDFYNLVWSTRPTLHTQFGVPL